MRPDFRPLQNGGSSLETPGMRGKINMGSIVNGAASATLGRPGNSPAEKMRTFSGGQLPIPPMSSLPLKGVPVTLSGEESVSLRDRPQYKLVNRGQPIEERKVDDANQVDLNVFIGNSNSAQNAEWLGMTGITNVLNTAAEIPNFFSNDHPNGYSPHYFNLKLKDEPTPGGEDLLAVLEPSFRYINGVIRQNPKAKILVHCHMGKSRSASIVIYYLMRSRGWSFEEALEFLKNKRPLVSPNVWYTRQLKDVDRMLTESR